MPFTHRVDSVALQSRENASRFCSKIVALWGAIRAQSAQGNVHIAVLLVVFLHPLYQRTTMAMNLA